MSVIHWRPVVSSERTSAAERFPYREAGMCILNWQCLFDDITQIPHAHDFIVSYFSISSVIIQFYNDFSYILTGRGISILESNVTTTKGEKNYYVHIRFNCCTTWHGVVNYWPNNWTKLNTTVYNIKWMSVAFQIQTDMKWCPSKSTKWCAKLCLLSVVVNCCRLIYDV